MMADQNSERHGKVLPTQSHSYLFVYRLFLGYVGQSIDSTAEKALSFFYLLQHSCIECIFF